MSDMMRLSCFNRSERPGLLGGWVLLVVMLVCSWPGLAMGATTYKVKKGDSLTSISRKLGVSRAQLMRHNGITDPDKISVGQLLSISGSPASDTTYTVRRGDSLSSISKKYGLSSVQLARHNGITNPNRISVGQRLRIPGHAGASSSATMTHLLPSSLSGVRVSSRWKTIVIHHSGSLSGDVKGMDRYHREERRMENGLAYHFVIGNGRRMKDGEIAMGNRWQRQIDGGHLASYKQNQTSIGICLVGNFDKQRPTKRQMESLRVLVEYLMDRCHLPSSAVKSHQQINVIHTRCPGKHFPIKTFMSDLKSAAG